MVKCFLVLRSSAALSRAMWKTDCLLSKPKLDIDSVPAQYESSTSQQCILRFQVRVSLISTRAWNFGEFCSSFPIRSSKGKNQMKAELVPSVQLAFARFREFGARLKPQRISRNAAICEQAQHPGMVASFCEFCYKMYDGGPVCRVSIKSGYMVKTHFLKQNNFIQL